MRAKENRKSTLTRELGNRNWRSFGSIRGSSFSRLPWSLCSRILSELVLLWCLVLGICGEAGILAKKA